MYKCSRSSHLSYVTTARKLEQVLPVRYCYNDGEKLTEIGSDLTRLAFRRYVKDWHSVEVVVAICKKCAAAAFACDHKEPMFRGENDPRIVLCSAIDIEIIDLCKAINNCARIL